jgi:glycosyltransferase involved in cell wall biosynthesis
MGVQKPESYFLCPGRIETMKRTDFVVKSLALTQQPVHIRFVGAATDPTYEKNLKKLVEEKGLAQRVSWEGFVSEERLAELYGKARAVVYTPLDEDYGYVSLEAALSRKPVITTETSGGALEFVNEDTGWVSKDSPQAFAQCLDEAWSYAQLCRSKGDNAHDSYRSKKISWDTVVETLTQA